MSSLPFWRLDAKGGESVGIFESCVVVRVWCVLLSHLNLVSVALGCFTSYGVRHMHSIVPYYLIEIMLYCAIYVMLIFTILFSVSLIFARYALSLKYRGSGDPSIRAVQSKAPILLAHI